MEILRLGGVARALTVAAALLSVMVALAPLPAPSWARAAALAVPALLAAQAAARALLRRREAERRERAAIALSHSVRTPLALIRALNEMLVLRRERSEEERTRWLHLIDREAHRLGGLADNLVAMAHHPGPGAFPARQPTDLGTLLQDAAVHFAEAAAARGMRIDLDPPSGILATVDPNAIRQAVSNLIDNAVRHGREGQTITVALRAGPGRAEITVADGGAGIRRGDRERIWEPFVALDGGEGGAGIGLAVVRRIARAHGGRAMLVQRAGGGACFRLELPIAPEPSPSLAAPRARLQPRGAAR